MKRLLLIIVFSGLLLRIYGAGHGLAAGRVFHPDTPKQMMFFNQYIEGDYRIRFHMGHRDYYGYPSFHIHAAEWAYRGIGLLARTAGYPGWELNPLHRWFFIRLITVFFSAASIVFVFLIGKELFTEKAGLIGAALFALHPFPVSMSHFIMGDTAMTFFALLTFYIFALCFRRQLVWLYLAGGVSLGLAAACKYNGAFMVIPGLFALSARPGRKTVYGFAALFFGAALGFTIGNPSMFTHFSEGWRAALAFSSYTSRVRWDTSQPRILVALAAGPEKLGMFAGLFGVIQCVLTAAAFVWMLAKKRNLRTLFAVIFSVAYLFLMIIAYPRLMPLHFLVLVPFFLLFSGWFLAEGFGRRRKEAVLIGMATAGILIFQGYSSYRESFLFRAGDTRISAEEWLGRNTPEYFQIDSSPYSARNPHSGEGVLESAGRFYVSSGLAGLVYPEGGFCIKEFSHEDQIPPVTFRNPDIKVLAYYGEELRPGFRTPVFNRLPFHGKLYGPLFLNGAEFGLDPFSFLLGGREVFTVVKKEPIESVAALITNFDEPAEVVLKFGRRAEIISLLPFESKLVNFERPARRMPFNRFYYNASFNKHEPRIIRNRKESRVFARLGFSPEEKALLYFESGNYEEAAEQFALADKRFTCPAELEILRAYSKKKAGDFQEAARIAGNIVYWAKDFLNEADACFEEAFLENMGISVRYLEKVNTVKMGGDEFASGGGRITRFEEPGKEPVFCRAIECGEGEKDVIFGPYVPLPPGNYFARFVVVLESFSSGAEIGFDVSAAAGEKILSAGHARPPEVSEDYEFLLPFTVRGKTEFLEFRTVLEGRGKLLLCYVEVFPDIEKNTLDKARMLKRIMEVE